MEKRKFKTTKVLSGVRTEYRAWKEWDEGDTLVCKLIGTSQNRKNKSKKDWIVESIEPFFEDKKEQKRLKPGVRITLNTAGQLDKGMEQLEIGAVLQVTYNGCVEMTGGDYKGQEAHTMEVCEVEEEGGEETSTSKKEPEEKDDEEPGEDDEDSDDL